MVLLVHRVSVRFVHRVSLRLTFLYIKLFQKGIQNSWKQNLLYTLSHAHTFKRDNFLIIVSIFGLVYRLSIRFVHRVLVSLVHRVFVRFFYGVSQINISPYKTHLRRCLKLIKIGIHIVLYKDTIIEIIFLIYFICKHIFYKVCILGFYIVDYHFMTAVTKGYTCQTQKFSGRCAH